MTAKSKAIFQRNNNTSKPQKKPAQPLFSDPKQQKPKSNTYKSIK